MANELIQKNTSKKTLQGTVVSTKMKDTIVVSVERFEKHPRYKKYIKLRKRYHVHDAGNTAKEGDTVTIVETRPMSKLKHFMLMSSPK